MRGAFPRSYLPRGQRQSSEWRGNFVRTFLERDLPSFGSRVPSRTMLDFWTMLAHYHGQTWNGSEIGRAFGVSHTAVRRYLDLLSASFMVRVLRPWAENIGKRVVKSPKVYVADSGLLHTLLGLETPQELARHPKVGASFEGFALEQVLNRDRNDLAGSAFLGNAGRRGTRFADRPGRAPVRLRVSSAQMRQNAPVPCWLRCDRSVWNTSRSCTPVMRHTVCMSGFRWFPYTVWATSCFGETPLSRPGLRLVRLRTVFSILTPAAVNVLSVSLRRRVLFHGLLD